MDITNRKREQIMKYIVISNLGLLMTLLAYFGKTVWGKTVW